MQLFNKSVYAYAAILLGLVSFQESGFSKEKYFKETILKELSSDLWDSVRLLSTPEKSDWDLMKGFIGAWNKKCSELVGNQKSHTCLITECDANLGNCRPNHVLLFRGEIKGTRQFGLSKLLRSHLDGSPLCDKIPCTINDLIETFKDVLQKVPQTWRNWKIFSTKQVGFSNINRLILHRIAGIWGWERKLLSEYGTGPHLSFAEFIAPFHFNANQAIEFQVEDSNVTYPLSPFSSFTTNPSTGLGYAGVKIQDQFFFAPIQNMEGVIIVASVPQDDIVTIDSSPDSLKPAIETNTQINSLPLGEFINMKSVPRSYDKEAELDSILYLDPTYIYGVYSTRVD